MMSAFQHLTTWVAWTTALTWSVVVFAADTETGIPPDLLGVTTTSTAIEAFLPTPKFDRHDPSNIIRHDDRYWVFYTRNV